MDSNTSAPQIGTVWSMSYKRHGFIIVLLENGMYQGIVQGGYYTPPCVFPWQVLQLVTDSIIEQEGEH